MYNTPLTGACLLKPKRTLSCTIPAKINIAPNRNVKNSMKNVGNKKISRPKIILAQVLIALQTEMPPVLDLALTAITKVIIPTKTKKAAIILTIMAKAKSGQKRRQRPKTIELMALNQ